MTTTSESVAKRVLVVRVRASPCPIKNALSEINQCASLIESASTESPPHRHFQMICNAFKHCNLKHLDFLSMCPFNNNWLDALMETNFANMDFIAIQIADQSVLDVDGQSLAKFVMVRI
uniref:F-box domain-containing protein n=1 Tax=Panagrellus redivivus TaxID=6233 RepID=A0A7E4VUI9_PANRE